MTASEYSSQGEVLMEADRLDDAAAVLREGHARFPDDPEICLHLAWVLHRRDDGEALSLARRVVELEPADPWLTLGVGWLLFDLQADELAASALRLTKRNLTEERSHLITSTGLLAAKLACRRGQYDVAEAALRTLQETGFEDMEAGLELFVLLQNRGREADARLQLESLLRREPEDEHLLELERATRPSV